MKDNFIEFNLVQEKSKTSIWVIRNIKSQMIIGYVKWHNTWRQYCFFTEPDCVFSISCLNNIIKFIQNENKKKIEKWKRIKLGRNL